MWLFYLAGLLLVAAIVGTFAGGGIFSLILFPLFVIALISAVWAGAAARASGAPQARRRSRRQTGPGGTSLPHHFPTGAGHEPTTPESLVEARLDEQ